MSIHDRDYYREQGRDVRSLRRKSGPTTIQVAIFWILVGAAAFLLLKDRLPHGGQQAQQNTQSTTTVHPASAQLSLDAAPAYTAPPPAAYTPPAAPPIYRCGDHYSNDPCTNARVIEAPAATGFDSRPSEKLAQLVANGRTAEANTYTSASTTTNTGSSGRAAECQGLASEVDAVDRIARQPLDMWRQNQLRAERQRARDRQAALHC